MSAGPLVSVVIPAYNAAATLDEALRSARAQSHRNLDIVVVDDGSTDETHAIAAQHAAADARVRVFRQRNAGVAAARNEGWRSARAELIAFLDADDLWAATKIERQLEALQSAGPQVGLVYCWYVSIDSRGLITAVQNSPAWAGDVLKNILQTNFIGNGSSALIRRQVLVDVGGFDSALQAKGAHGCEDYLLYFRVAEAHHFAVVTDHLVGYRNTPNNMSSDRPRMLQSWMLVFDEMLSRHREQSSAVRHGLRTYAGWLVGDALSNAARRQVPRLLQALAIRHPMIAFQVLVRNLIRPSISRLLGRNKGRPGHQAKAMNNQIGSVFPVGGIEP